MAFTYTNAHYEELNNIVRTGSKWCFCAGAFSLVPYGEMSVVFGRDTFEIKEVLKASGARWNRDDRNWKIAVTDAAMADRIIRRAAYADRKATEAGRKDAAKAWAKAWCEWTPAPKTFKISLAKLAQAAAAHLAAAAEAKAEAAKAAAPARKISLRPVVAAAVKGAAHAVRSARARKGWETRRRNAARKAEANCTPVDSTVCAPALSAVVTPCAAAGTHCAATERDYCETGCRLRSAAIFRCPPAAAFNAIGERACTEPGTWTSPRMRRNARRRELYRLRRAA